MNMFATIVDEFSDAVDAKDIERMAVTPKILYRAVVGAILSAQLSFDINSDAFEKLKNTSPEVRGQVLNDFVAFTIDDSQCANTLYMFSILLEFAETNALSSVNTLMHSTKKRISSMIAQKDERIDLCDFSFLNSPISKRPLILGKPKKSGKRYPHVSTDKLVLMHTSYFISDKGMVRWFDAQEKKHYKIRKNESNQLYRLEEGREILFKNVIMNFAISPKGGLYAAGRGAFNHSAFLAGQPVLCAGELVFKQGKIVELSGWSGHYQPSAASFLRAILWLYSSEYIDENCNIKFYCDTKEAFGVSLNKTGVTVKQLLDNSEMQEIIKKTTDEMKISLPKRARPGSMRV